MQPQLALMPSQDSASKLQHWFFTSSFFKAVYQEEMYESRATFSRDRVRCVFSLMRGVAVLLDQLFKINTDDDGSQYFHVLNSHIVDDTSTRLRGPCHNDPTTIYTIMNSVQTVSVRLAKMDSLDNQMDNCCLNFRVPTPLIVVDNPDAKGIHQSFSSCALLTANGLGEMFERFGLAKDLVKSVPWKTFLFVGDALKANGAAFKSECQQLRKKDSTGKHLALRLKCGIHQICLIRKPIVLMVPKLWTTIVRLGHLFESLSFRKSFASTMTSILRKSFTYLPVSKMPLQTAPQLAKREMLKNYYQIQSKLRKQALADCLDFLNGDLESECIFHFCIPKNGNECCKDYHDSLNKCLKLVVPFLCRGFPTPLLYRFKHYDGAVGYLKVGFAIHKLLQRTLNEIQLDKTASGKDEALISNLLADIDLAKEGIDGSSSAVQVNEELLNEDESTNFAAYNAKRKALVHQEIMREGFISSTNIVSVVLKPMDQHMNMLFARSTKLTQLALLGPQHESWESIAKKSRDMFLSIVLGHFGWDIIADYVEMLMPGGLQSLAMAGLDLATSVQEMKVIFQMILVIFSDTWKRCIHDLAGYPLKLFQLLRADLSNFVVLWDVFQSEYAQCGKCLDYTFSKKLLDAFPKNLGQQTPEVQLSVYNEVRLILHDIATHGPTTSDAVEVKNGQVQAVASSRGNEAVKTPWVAKETSFLQSAIRGYELVKHWVEGQTTPPKRQVAGILRKVGRPGVGKFTRRQGAKKFMEPHLAREIKFLFLIFTSFMCSSLT